MKKGTIDPRRRLGAEFSLSDLWGEQDRYHKRTGRKPDAMKLTPQQNKRLYWLFQQQFKYPSDLPSTAKVVAWAGVAIEVVE